jgi:peptide/nickel transport system ATP-binding protein
MINNNIILEVKGLTVKIKNNILLNSVSFEIKEGEVFALIGESGSGKSLTSLAIMRLLPDTIKITAGEIYLRDKPLFKLPEYQMQKIRGNSIAMIFQEPMIALNPVITIGKQVAEIIKLHLNLKRWEIENRVVSLFNEVGIREPHRKYSWYPHQLSGGERQRVIIAMALACEPDLLIADEPTTALDVTIQAQVLNLLKNIQRKRSLSILFITHDIALVAQMADRVAIMRDGNIVEQSSIDNFFTKSKHPYSKQLIQNIKIRRKNREVKGKKILEVKDLKVYFPIKKGMFRKTTQYIKAVNGVSLSIESGKSLALVGESGSGKSLAMKSVLGIIDFAPGIVNGNIPELGENGSNISFHIPGIAHLWASNL